MFDTLGAVIFDLDGLLIDSEPLWVRAEIDVFGAAGVDLEEADCARTKGLRIDDVVAYWHALYPSRFRLPPREVELRLVDRVVELVRTEGRPLPGIARAVASARAAGAKLALASSSPPPIIEAALERLGLADTFAVVQSAAEEPFGKPHPAVFLRTAERLGVSPLRCVVLEDSMTGVVAAKSARMGCVAVPFDHPKHEARFVLADAVVASLADVDEALLARVAGR